MPALNRLVIYTKKIDEMTAFYCEHFGYSAHIDPDERIVELRPAEGGAILMLHKAGKATKEGQVLVKLTFDVPDVTEFCAKCDIPFGKIHQAEGYQFANAKDPAGNSISLSSRAFRV